MAALERGGEYWHMKRHDAWLGTSLQGWAGRADQDRIARLTAAARIAREARLVQDNDVRLLAWLFAALDAQAEAYFARSDICEVMGWDVANRGAILYELFTRAGADIGPVLGML